MSAGNRSLRTRMPRVAEFIDACRDVFGVEAVDRAIRNGMRGGADFCAEENGLHVGGPFPVCRGVHPDQMGLLASRPESAA